MKLDALDLRILDELQRNGSLSNVELAKRVHLSPSPCLARVKALEAARIRVGERMQNPLKDISFDTISGSGENAAIIHYRVTTDTNRAFKSGEMFLVDSGGQYINGTTDITRTVAIGSPSRPRASGICSRRSCTQLPASRSFTARPIAMP